MNPRKKPCVDLSQIFFQKKLDFKDTGAESELQMKILQCNQVILSRNLAFGAILPEPAFFENLDSKVIGAESELRMKILQCNQVILSRNLAFGAKLPEPAFLPLLLLL